MFLGEKIDIPLFYRNKPHKLKRLNELLHRIEIVGDLQPKKIFSMNLKVKFPQNFVDFKNKGHNC